MEIRCSGRSVIGTMCAQYSNIARSIHIRRSSCGTRNRGPSRLNRTRCSVRATTEVGSIWISPREASTSSSERGRRASSRCPITASSRARRREISTRGSGMAEQPIGHRGAVRPLCATVPNRCGSSPVSLATTDPSPRSTVRRVKIDDPSSDQALMAAFVARDERAAGALYDRFASRVYGLGIVMLGNDHAAQDLVQDTFVKLWRTGARFDPERGRLETWILLTARSLAIDLLRRRVLESRSLQELGPPPVHDPGPGPAEPAPPPVHDPARGPDDLAATADLASRARRAMAKLSNEQRSALELAYFGGRTTAEVAALEGIPQGTAKTRIHAALLKLRAEMAKEADDDV